MPKVKKKSQKKKLQTKDLVVDVPADTSKSPPSENGSSKGVRRVTTRAKRASKPRKQKKIYKHSIPDSVKEKLVQESLLEDSWNAAEYEITDPKQLAKQKAHIISVLRRGTYKWPQRYNAQNAARRARGLYECAICGEVVPKYDCKMDHRFPVVNPSTGFVGFDDYAKRMYPLHEKSFQNVCSRCHYWKSYYENKRRS